MVGSVTSLASSDLSQKSAMSRRLSEYLEVVIEFLPKKSPLRTNFWSNFFFAKYWMQNGGPCLHPLYICTYSARSLSDSSFLSLSSLVSVEFLLFCIENIMFSYCSQLWKLDCSLHIIVAHLYLIMSLYRNTQQLAHSSSTVFSCFSSIYQTHTALMLPFIWSNII